MLSAALILLGAGSVNAATIVTSNFESGYGGWTAVDNVTGNAPNDASSVTLSSAGQSSDDNGGADVQGVAINRQGNMGIDDLALQYAFTTTYTGDLTVTFDIQVGNGQTPSFLMRDAANNQAVNLRFWGPTSALAVHWFGASGVNNVNFDGGGTVTLSSGNWYRVTVDTDMTAETFDLNILGLDNSLNKTATGLSFRVDSAGGLAGIDSVDFVHLAGAGATNNAPGATFYIDNASITAVPEPSAAALLGLALVGCLIARRHRA